MSLLVNSAIRLYGPVVSMRFDTATRSPAETQERLLRKILKENSQTSFGQAHGFAGILSEKEFRAQVPIREYEEFRPYVNQVLAGKKRVLTMSEPVRFNITSGTTGEPKYIPITRETQKHELNLIGQWYYRALRDHPQFLDRLRLAVVSPLNDGITDSGLPVGSASGMVVNRIPSFIRQLYAIPEEILETKNYEERYFLIARFGLDKEISFLLTPNPTTLLRLANVIEKEKERLVRSIHDGTCGIESSVAPAIKAALSPNPHRAKFLENVVIRTGSLKPMDAWPTLRLIACWLGGSVGIQARKLSEAYGNTPIRDCGYMASEGHITLPIEDGTASGVLTIQSNYYEFIPEDEQRSKNPTILASHQLEIGKKYLMVLTTSSGLYRYDINDVVEVTGRYHETPLLAFVRKGRDMTNITGEKMHANHFVMAIEGACKRFKLDMVQFRVVPDLEQSRYCICLELREQPAFDFIKQEVLPHIDESLASANVEYAEKRKSGRLKPPAINLMSPGWSEREFQRSLKLGRRDVQFKWRVLCHESTPEDKASIVSVIQ